MEIRWLFFKFTWLLCMHTYVHSNLCVGEKGIDFFPACTVVYGYGNSHKAGLHRHTQTHIETFSYCMTQQFVRKVCIITMFDLISMFAMLHFAPLT